MHNPVRVQPFLVQLSDLTRMQLSNWRWSWRGMVVTGMIAPVLSIAALGVFARDSGSQVLQFVLCGNIVLALMFENQNRVCGNFAYMRAMGTLNYFATLPIQHYTLILATVLSFLFLSLPALLVTVLLGAYLLGLPLHPSLWLLAAIPAAALPLAGIGALIGTSARTPEEAGSLSTLVTFILLGLGPVLIPPERLPGFMLFLGYFSPATYASSVLRQALLGPVTVRLWLDLAVLIGLTVLIFVFVGRRMDWRQVE